MDLPTVWFTAVAVLWTGYLVLEGFDFGVGMHYRRLAGNPTERTRLLSTILPVWDGNEVWLIVAIGAMFAAFPAWYAGLLSGFYPLFLLALVALIVRAVGLEYRAKRPDETWRRRADTAVITGSYAIPATWGVIWSGLVAGVPLDATGALTGTTTDLLHPYSLTGGAVLTALTACHGACFLTLKTTGPLADRAHHTAKTTATIALPATVAFAWWTTTAHGDTTTGATAVALTVFAATALAAAWRGRGGWAFAATSLTVAGLVAVWFTALHPYVLPAAGSSPGLTLGEAASSPYTLSVMSVAALVFLPLVLAYQGWTYWVFRKRISAPPV